MEDPDLAVALSDVAGSDDAPRVVAKGRGALAAQIVAIARDHGVEVRARGGRPSARRRYRRASNL